MRADLRELAGKVASKIYPDDASTAISPALIGLLIDLLPVILEMVLGNCGGAGDSKSIQRLAKQRGLIGRWNRRWFSMRVRWAVRGIQPDDPASLWDDLGGDGFTTVLMELAADDENQPLLQSLLTTPPEAPMVGIDF